MYHHSRPVQQLPQSQTFQDCSKSVLHFPVSKVSVIKREGGRTLELLPVRLFGRRGIVEQSREWATCPSEPRGQVHLLLIILPSSQCPVGTYAILLGFLKQRQSTGSDSLITKLKLTLYEQKLEDLRMGAQSMGAPWGRYNTYKVGPTGQRGCGPGAVQSTGPHRQSSPAATTRLSRPFYT